MPTDTFARTLANKASQSAQPLLKTRAAAASSMIPSDAEYVRTSGFANAGDFGGALYKRVNVQPTHAGKFQSTDGAWWEIAELVVTPEMYGAVGDGVNDDTTAFAAAAAVRGQTIRLSSGKSYLVGDFTIADGVQFKGYCPRGYTGYTGVDLYNAPRMLMKSGAKCLMNVNNTRGVGAEGILFDGQNRTAPVFSAGSTRLTLNNCRIINGLNGIGGVVDGGSGYTRVLSMIRCVVASNSTGIRNLIDSFVSLNEIAANGTNLSMSAGSNSNIFIGGRYEWPSATLGDGQNIRFAGSAGSFVEDNTFIGVQLDRGDNAGVYLAFARGVTFNGGFVRRANASASTAADSNCLVYMVGSQDISFIGMGFSRGADDGGGGATTPDYVFSFGTGCDRVTIQGGICRGGFTAFLRGTGNCTNLDVAGIPGVADFSNDPLNPQASNGTLQRARASGSAAASGGAVNLTLATGLALGTFATEPLELLLSARNATTGVDYVAKIVLTVQTESGAATVAGLTVIGQSTASFIGVGTGTLQLSTANVSASGGSFDLVVTNTAANAMQVTVRLTL